MWAPHEGPSIYMYVSSLACILFSTEFSSDFESAPAEGPLNFLMSLTISEEISVSTLAEQDPMKHACDKRYLMTCEVV